MLRRPTPTPMPARRASATRPLVAAALAGVLAVACSNDGRELRPAGPGQDATISAPPAPSTTITVPPPITEPAGTPDSGGNLPGGDVDFGTVRSAWEDGELIPVRHTCDDLNVAPPLSWSAAPEDAVGIGVALVDEDAPDFAHWAMAGIDPAQTALAEGEIPVGAITGTNGVGVIGYFGPCPPEGTVHTYRLIVFYLGEPVTLADGTPGDQLLTALTEAAIASSSLTGVYDRSGS